MNGPLDADEPSYGTLLGEYFAVASNIGRLQSRLGPEELDGAEKYADLLERRRALRERLDRVAADGDDSAIEVVLDEAFADD